MSLKTISILLISLSVIMTVGSIFLFAIGWDKFNQYLESSSIKGRLVFPNIGNVGFKVSINLEKIENSNLIAITLNKDNEFYRPEISPGKYNLIVKGKGVITYTKEFEIFPRKNINLGTIHLGLETKHFFKKEKFPFRISTVCFGPKKTLFVSGFSIEENNKSKYKIFYKNNNSWNELIIPFFNDDIQVVSSYLFSDDSFMLGSIYKGAAIFNGKINFWEKVSLPKEILGITQAMELPDKSWLCVGLNVRTGYIIKSLNYGKTWNIYLKSDDPIIRVNLLSTNRMILGTESLSNGAALYYSDDMGETWEQSFILNKEKKLRGIKALLELNNGEILAGNQDGRHWKGDFLKGSIIFKSIDKGRTWTTVSRNENWNGVDDFYETSDKKLFVWSKGDVFRSFDCGISWIPVFSTGSGGGYWNNLIKLNDAIYVIDGQVLNISQTLLDDESLKKFLKDS